MLHRTIKGITKERLHEDLVLDDQTRVPGPVVQYLASFQLEGIRFLHKHYVEKSDCILNDDKFLGKCFQTTVFLSSITCTNRFSFRCLILCKNRDKLLNWLYHIELLTDLNAVQFKSTKDLEKNNILVQLVEEIQNKSNQYTTVLWDYVIFDETGENAFTDNDIVVLKQIETKVTLVVSTRDIVQNVRHLKRLLLVLDRKDDENYIFKRVIGKFKRSRNVIRFRELLICYCKQFLLRRYGREISASLPLTHLDIHRRNFNNWYKGRGCTARKVGYDESQINPKTESLHSQSTEEMAPLVLDSDTEDELGESWDLMQFERKSSDVEILTQKLPSPITLSSENPHQRQSSPDMFDSLEEDDSEKTSTYDLTGSLFKFKKKLNTEKVSTPIIITTSANKCSSLKQQNSDDLFDGITTMIEEDENNTHLDTGKLFEESNRTSVFEITKNSEFPNVIRINSDTEMSPVDNKSLSKIVADSPNLKTTNLFENQKSNKNFHYFFDNDVNENENVGNSTKIVDLEKCFTPKSTKTPNTSGSSSNTKNRWIAKSGSSVKRKLSDSFDKLKSKRLKNHDITKLQDDSNKGSNGKNIPRASSDQIEKKMSWSDCDHANSCSVLFRKSKFNRFLSHSLASSDEDF